MDVAASLLDQLEWHWEHQLRPRLDGLSDEEYLWEPVAGCWSLRPKGESTAPIQGGAGEMVVEFAYPEPEPAPVTTIAWRLAHVIVGVLGARVHSHFDGPEADYLTWEYAPTAAGALDQLDTMHTAWVDGVRRLDDWALCSAVGEAEGPWAGRPMIDLVLHIHREVIHHGAEIALLRDLYARRT